MRRFILAIGAVVALSVGSIAPVAAEGPPELKLDIGGICDLKIDLDVATVDAICDGDIPPVGIKR